MDKPTVYFETERLYVRSLTEADHDYYMTLRIEESGLKKIYDRHESLRQEEWENELNNDKDISLAAFLKSDNTFVSSASYQSFRKDTIELGFDVVKEHRNHGIATELVKKMIETAHILFPGKQIVIKTRKDNDACKRVAEKCGGTLIGTEAAWAVRALQGLMKSLEEMKYPDDEWDEEREEALEIIEDCKNGVLVYRIDV